MAIAGAGLNGRDGSALHHRIDEASRTTGNHDVDKPARRDEILHRIVAFARQELHALARKVEVRQGVLEDLHELLVGVACGLRSAQQRHVARLERKAKGIHRDVRAGLVDHAHDAERHAHLLHLDAVVHGVAPQYLPYWVLQGGDLAQAAGDTFDARGVKREPVD